MIAPNSHRKQINMIAVPLCKREKPSTTDKHNMASRQHIQPLYQRGNRNRMINLITQSSKTAAKSSKHSITYKRL